MADAIQNGRRAAAGRPGKALWYRSAVAALAAGLAAGLAASVAARAEEPPKDLLRQVARQGTLFEQERERYTYRQKFHFFELDPRGATRGDYLEVRDVLFGPDGQRTEEFVKKPVSRLQRMRLTDEDFRDIRDMQPFVVTEDTLWLYETRYQGEEYVNGRPCWVYRIRPRQVLEGQRLLDGQVWIDREAKQVVQASGLPLPQHYRTENANLFPRFVTVYAPVDGRFWFPVRTLAEDTLAFPSGLQRVRYEIDYENYRRFSAESTVTFAEPEGAAAPPRE